jgi:hypothetical protein
MKKFFEFALRAIAAGIRPITIIWTIEYYPVLTAPFFFCAYFSPLIYKLASLSQINRYRRLIIQDESFENISNAYYGIVLLRILTLLIIFSIIDPMINFLPTSLFFLFLFSLCESFFFNREFTSLQVQKPFASAAYLLTMRWGQAICVFFAYLQKSGFSGFILNYSLLTLFFLAIYFFKNSFSLPKKQQIRCFFKARIYAQQFAIGAKEIFSLAYFSLTTVFVSSADSSIENAKYYIIGFSVSGFFIMLIRVLFINSRMTELTKKNIGFDSGLKVKIAISILPLILLILIFGKFWVLGDYVLAFGLFGSFYIFIIVNILNQRILLFLSARRVERGYAKINFLMLFLVSISLYSLRSSPLYLALVVAIPGLVALLINMCFMNNKIIFKGWS